MVVITRRNPSLSEDEKPRLKDIKEMVGDFLREVAALVLVFSFLEKLTIGYRVTFWWIFWTVTLALGLLILGISLERRRSK